MIKRVVDLNFENCSKCRHSYKDANGNVLCGKAKSGNGFIHVVQDADDFIWYNENSIKCFVYQPK